MILLDTNVISEWMKPSPEPCVIAWLDEQPASHLFLSCVAKAEIETGIAWLPLGQRKTALSIAAQAIFDVFTLRCLALDCQTTVEYARVLSLSKYSGRPISVEDAQIAAIAYRHSMTLATRNLSDLDFLADLDLVNPWQEGAAS